VKLYQPGHIGLMIPEATLLRADEEIELAREAD